MASKCLRASFQTLPTSFCRRYRNGSHARSKIYPAVCLPSCLTADRNCIIRQLRNSGKYVSYKDIKELMNDLKAVYAAPDEQSAL